MQENKTAYIGPLFCAVRTSWGGSPVYIVRLLLLDSACSIKYSTFVGQMQKLEDNMNNQVFSHVTCDYYSRHYELNPTFTNGLPVTIYAECSPNGSGMNGHYYALDLYFSADGIAVRDFITGVSFGEGQMDKRHLDEAIDNWVGVIVSDEFFPGYVKDYIRKEKIWENILNNKFLDEKNDTE